MENTAAAGTDRDPNKGSDASGYRAVRRRLRSVLEPRFGVDLRALAAFRIGLGLLVLADLLFRARDLTTFYTDHGVLPRSAHAEVYPVLARVSVHTVTGSTWGQAGLFVLGGAFAALLAVGYRTRIATLGTVLLHASLYARNPYVLNGGDTLLVLGLFLGLFLPLGERWSIDALNSERRRTRVASLATAALLAQLVVIYVANVGFKLRSDAWRSGEAVRQVLELEQFSVLLGPWLTAFPELLSAFTWLWIGTMAAAPLLVLATGRLRAAVAAWFAAFHLGMLATMRLGLFPLVVVAFFLPYLPSGVWDAVDRYAGRWARLARRVPDRFVRTARSGTRFPPVVRRSGRVVATLLLVGVLLGSVLWPATALGDVATPDVASIETDGYAWTLFAPDPPSSVRWFVAPTELDSGERIDAFDGSDVDWDEPPDAAESYPSALWHRYLGEVRFAGADERRPLAAYLCRQADQPREANATRVSIYAVERPVEAAGGGEPQRRELTRLDCSEARVPSGR